MILTKIIETTKNKILVVGGLPEDADKDSIDNVRNGVLYYYTGVSPNHCGEEIKIPKGKWQPLGFLRDIEEDVAKELVDDPNRNGDYCDYVYDPDESYWQTETVKESLYSLLEFNCLLKNKYGEKPKISNYYTDSRSPLQRGNTVQYSRDLKQWREEQGKVFTNPLIFIEK